MLRFALLLAGASLVAGLAADFTRLDDVELEMISGDGYSAPDTFRTALSARGAAPNVCNGGSVSLDVAGDFAPCRLKQGDKNKDFLALMSPKDNAGKCEMVFDSAAPGFVRAKLAKANLSGDGKLVYTGAFGDEIEFSSEDAGKKFIFPTTFGSIRYEGSAENRAKMPKDFMLNVLPQSNNCQRFIDAPLGTGGRLIFPGFDQRDYKPGTMCQWWIQAPKGKKIKVNFNAFNVGTDVPDCKGTDYIGIDKSGDPTYRKSPLKFCGQTTPEEIISDDNLLNILGNGAQGGRGFCCTYEVIEP